ncbi:Ras-like protein [Fusarium oxysporum f. sp. rapae]|uniref:Ras-like protein n=1 Tax=Fusarium oxysporum f. sp. rapae TaxID=485398 RepID=A0A8J5P0U6_FUSOX|nr:Ras-like protein [Fusarium oxysporum f. sp. rapae]
MSQRLMQKKVISLVRLLLARLSKAGMIQAVVFESAPNIFAVEPNPAGLAVDAFLCDERLYLKCLESLFENANKTRSVRGLPTGIFEPLLAPVDPLVNVQRKFLIKAEMLVSKPYLQQTWQLAFQEWSIESRAYYAIRIPMEAELKSMVRTALSSVDVHDAERRGIFSDVLAMLGLPSERLDKYDAFLQELTQYGLHEPDHIKSAKESLKVVKEAVENSNITRELNRVKAALSQDQDHETNKIIAGLGKLLMFDKVDIMDGRGNLKEKNQLYLFQKGILQAVEFFPKDRRRGMLGYGKPSRSDRLKTRLSIIRIIPAKDIKQVLLSSGKELNGCEIKWMDAGKEFSISFNLGSRTRIIEWINQVKNVKDQNRLNIPSQNLQRKFLIEYPLVLMGASGCGKSDLTIQFINPDFWDEFDPSEEDKYHKSCIIDGEFALIDVIDTTGQEEYSAMIQQYIREGAGFMLVYSVTSRESFEGITSYYEQILKQKGSDYFPMIIIGSECCQESLREVTKQEGESLARALGCMFVEVDAKADVNINMAFFNLVRMIRRYRRNMLWY